MRNISVDTEFQKVMSIILAKPMRKDEFDLVDKILKGDYFKPEMVSKLLKILFKDE